MRNLTSAIAVLLLAAGFVTGCGSIELASSSVATVAKTSAATSLAPAGSSLTSLRTASTARPTTTSEATTTTPSTTLDSLPAGWKTFRGDSISLALPDYFTGGDLSDPATLAFLMEIRNTATGLDVESMMKAAMRGMELFMLDEPNADGYSANVSASRQPLPESMTLEQAVELFVNSYPKAKVESVTGNRAYLISPSLPGEAPMDATLQHFAIIIAGSDLCIVCYTFDDPSNAALDSVFRTSAETISVK